MATQSTASTDTATVNAIETDDAEIITTTSDPEVNDTMSNGMIEFEFETRPSSVGEYEVNDLRDAELASATDWMSKLLLSKEFQLLPATNLQAIFARLEPIEYAAGAHVIEQDQIGEYFYIITRGRAIVTRKLPTGNGCLTLAELTVGDTFGEEALITDATRQATITMITDGSIMRLSKTDFKELLSEPIVSFVSAEEAESIIATGGQWLDVGMRLADRSEEEPNIKRIPMYMLRLKLDTLDLAIPYVVTSTNTTHSCAAAHILSQYGFETRVLETANGQ